MKIRPTRNRVVVKKKATEEKTPGGIVIPESEQKPQTTGEVVAAGIDDLGETLNVGDIILFGKYAGTPIKVQNEDFIIMKYDEVIAVLESSN
jgi:chaperonin GroES